MSKYIRVEVHYNTRRMQEWYNQYHEQWKIAQKEN